MDAKGIYPSTKWSHDLYLSHFLCCCWSWRWTCLERATSPKVGFLKKYEIDKVRQLHNKHSIQWLKIPHMLPHMYIYAVFTLFLWLGAFNPVNFLFFLCLRQSQKVIFLLIQTFVNLNVWTKTNFSWISIIHLRWLQTAPPLTTLRYYRYYNFLCFLPSKSPKLTKME